MERALTLPLFENCQGCFRLEAVTGIPGIFEIN